ncbi:MAG TPA: hypothetical protein VFC78_23105 [Tepidisphaeraceae bacterium]|nr:hypothetical protein [Tepidisphaeraceae bacterium]
MGHAFALPHQQFRGYLFFQSAIEIAKSFPTIRRPAPTVTAYCRRAGDVMVNEFPDGELRINKPYLLGGTSVNMKRPDVSVNTFA